MIKSLSQFVEEQPDIYPMEGGGIVIDLENPDMDNSILMVVERDGSGTLFYQLEDGDDYKSVDDAEDLPNLLRAISVQPENGGSR